MLIAALQWGSEVGLELMKTFTYQDEQWIPRPRAEVFSFFAEAHNLEAITPSWLRFEVLTPGRIGMRVGALIEYRLRVHGIPIRWQTEITAWEPSHRFVDEQRRGPYRLWRHEHTFFEADGGTLCRDGVKYCVAGGALVNRLFVRRDVERIFAYRREALAARFLGKPDSTALRI